MQRMFVLALLPAALLAADRAPPRYLDGMSVPDLTRVLPAPPVAGDPRNLQDRATFADDRFTAFACAVGQHLDARRVPALARVFVRMSDGGMVDRAKAAFAVRRPYLDRPGAICEPRTAHLAENGDYPSGHTSNGWATALILAELMPERATEILRRGRQYGESRFICGAHSRSAVEAGYLAGAAIVSQLHARADFRRDMDRARQELAGLAQTKPDEPHCLED